MIIAIIIILVIGSTRNNSNSNSNSHSKSNTCSFQISYFLRCVFPAPPRPRGLRNHVFSPESSPSIS